ncbi:MAG: hypothetical protein ACRD2J_14600 [Thermoanaerobaculia bacterium]
MKASGIVPIAAAAILLTTACSTTTPQVDMSESLRVLGREGDVRIDAQLETNEFAPSSLVSLVYEIENLGDETIVFAEVHPAVEYLADQRMITVTIGAEIPREEALPKLRRILPGERRTFTAGARLSVSRATIERLAPRYLQVKLSYLDGAEPFEPYLEAAVPRVDEALFRTWVDHIAAVFTNALPIHWRGSDRPAISASSQMPLLNP